MKHVTNPDIINPRISARIQRAMDQLCSAIVMIETGRSCCDVAEQLDEVESVVAEAKRELINEHIDRFLMEAAEGPTPATRGTLAEIKALTRFL